MNQPRAAFLGLGTMGSGMAERLLLHGFPTRVYNRDRRKAEAFAARGAVVAASPGEAAADADVIIAMLADDQASREVWLGEHGALSAAAKGSVLVECSTLTVQWVTELAGVAAQRHCEFLDAPVTGSKPHAAAGELLFLVGGAADVLEKVRPVLSVMSRGIVHLGPVGSGALLKLINNFLCGVQTAAMAEALAFIQAAGLDRDQAVKVLGEGAPGSPILRRTADRAARNDFVPDFSLRLMAKDMRYAVEEAARAGVDLQTAAAALARFRQGESRGFGEEDFAAVTLSVRDLLRTL